MAEEAVDNLVDTGKLLDRIQKLLNLAENSGATQAEAATAAAKAAELLFKYNLTMGEVAVATNKLAETIETAQREGIETGPWRRDLMWVLCSVNFCRAAYSPYWRRFTLLGERQNLEVVEYLYGYLERELVRLEHEAWRALPSRSRSHESYATWRVHFLEAAVMEIHRRLREQFVADRSASVESTALVVSKDAALNEAVAGMFPKTTAERRTGRQSFSAAGFEAGQAAARALNIHKGVTDSESNPLSLPWRP